MLYNILLFQSKMNWNVSFVLWLTFIITTTEYGKRINPVEAFRTFVPKWIPSRGLIDIPIFLDRENSLFMSTISSQVDVGQYWDDFDSMVVSTFPRQSEKDGGGDIDIRDQSTTDLLNPSRIIIQSNTYGGEQAWMDAQRKLHFTLYKKATSVSPRPRLLKTVPSTQDQLPALQRIAKVELHN